MRAEPREPSPPPARASDAIILEPPEGDTAEGQRNHEIQKEGSSAPTGGNLGASSIGTEASHDKPPVVPEHPDPQNQAPIDVEMRDVDPSDQVEQQQQQKQQQKQTTEPSAPPKERVTSSSSKAKKKTPSDTTSVPTQQRAQKSAPMTITKTIDTKAAEKQAKLQRAAGGNVVIAKSGASAPVIDRQLVVSEAVSQKLRVHRETRALAGPSAGFASYKTKSGSSFGSLRALIDKWNDADDEVTSTVTPSGPAVGIAERKIEQAVTALAEAKAATKVCFGTYTYPSPRDLGRTSNVRPESLINFHFPPKHAYLPSSPRVSTAIHFLRSLSARREALRLPWYNPAWISVRKSRRWSDCRPCCRSERLPPPRLLVPFQIFMNDTASSC